MKTPKEYSDNLKSNIITRDMLIDCLFSVNKRAKNCRDKEQEYREFYRYMPYVRDKYHSVASYREKKNEYYEQKDKLLTLIQPTSIHQEDSSRRRRIRDYEPEYRKFARKGKYIHDGSYYDYATGEEVCFVDIMEPVKRYYLFYDMGKYSFHSPLEEEQLSSYTGLEVKNIGQLKTKGKEIGELISVQFVKKVIDLIESGTYIFVDEQNSLESAVSA